MAVKDYDITEAIGAVERELTRSMIRNMKRHRVEEITEKKEWTMWQAEQLKALEQYRRQNHKKFTKQFDGINRSMGEVLKEARKLGGLEQEEEILRAIQSGFKGYKRKGKTVQAAFFRLNDRKLNALIKATTKDMKKAETAVLRMANDQYRKIIYNAQVYANTGAGTYDKAVDMATKDMLASGLNCIQYANGARHTLADYTDMAIRTASKRAYLAGEGRKRQEWGVSTVIVNKRGNPCPKCLPFVGKIFIDDVWSGGEKGDGPYPLLSTAIAAGLYHPRCKDGHTTYFPGVSASPEKLTRSDVKKTEQDYREDQKKQYARRQAERFERLAEGSLDPENQKQYHEKAWHWRGLAASGNGVITPMTTPKFVERIDVADAAMVESKLKEYEALIRDAKEEHAYVILQNGKVYHFTGELNGVNPKRLGAALERSIMTHNHPLGSSNEYSFSSLDIGLFGDAKLKCLRGVDERFSYVLDRTSGHRDVPVLPIDMNLDGSDYRHSEVALKAEELDVGYWREQYGG